MKEIRIMGLETIPIVGEGDDIGALICEAAGREGIELMDGDVVVVSHIIVSRSEGRVVDLSAVRPSDFAKNVAEAMGKDPKLVEVVLRESKSIARMGDGHLICETKHGFICANAGVDRSNVPGEDRVALLPEDPDASARRIRERIRQLTGRDVAVIISDTHGRPLRLGTINVAIGVAGLEPIWDRRGDVDLFGYTLRVTQVAVADELASAAELLMGQADEGIPVVIIRGYRYRPSEDASARELIRPREQDLFL
ncbi:coenzyme F420-0:L-glutamate ligase [Candidatus Bathyarchaeota archaeon]|nr:MAG: coenzyme F420-0:L-glutamate ligase [Candidatus Bathyarchaeota archaeon]